MVKLEERYKSEIRPKLRERFGYKNELACPRIEKIVINMGIGDATQDIKLLDKAMEELTLITGQRPVKTYAKKSVAGFKLKKGMPIGCKVTLRRERMYEFLNKLINVSLPRVRDFRGVPPNSFDGFGNYTLGIKEQIIFPEIDYDNVSKVMGMNICIVTTSRSDDKARELLSLFGMPFSG
ncbi:MAG: 50S ribosomal protein L5 [bacterium]|nr:50S ribosomal protein L5 [bacterium]